MAEETGERAGLRNRASEGVVGVFSDNGPGGVGVGRDIAVRVGERDVD